MLLNFAVVINKTKTKKIKVNELNSPTLNSSCKHFAITFVIMYFETWERQTKPKAEAKPQ